MDFFHVLNRGVDKRSIFVDVKDRIRFINNLFTFNDTENSLHPHQPERRDKNEERKPLVHLHAFCLMQNHYHFLLSELVDGGISLFMQKVNMGYTKYFNERHGRTGTLWQGKYKKISIERDAHFMYIPFYIHLNALDASMPEWREGNVKNPQKALVQLQKYRWSSHLDYLNITNFPSLTYRKEIQEMLGTPKMYEKEIIKIISSPDIASLSTALE